MDNYIKKNIMAYDSTVEEYYKNTKDLGENEKHIRNLFMTLAKKGGKILDLGCGPGRDAKIFSEKGFKVVGIDLSGQMVLKAKKIAPLAEFRMMGFMNIRFNPGYFDAVWFEAGLLCVEKKNAAQLLNDINKILADKGILYMSIKEGMGEGFEHDRRYNHEKFYAYYQEEEVRKLLTDAGFGIIKFSRVKSDSPYHTHNWLYFFCRKKS